MGQDVDIAAQSDGIHIVVLPAAPLGPANFPLTSE